MQMSTSAPIQVMLLARADIRTEYAAQYASNMNATHIAKHTAEKERKARGSYHV